MSDEEADVLDPKEELLKNQRKEKKDLQAKIQALKKTASKGDRVATKNLRRFWGRAADTGSMIL